MSSPTDVPHGEATPPDPRNTPRVTIRIEEAVAAAAMALICVITFANVVVRYLTNASFAFTEEISVFLLKLPRPAQFALELLGMALSAALFTMVAWYGWRFFLDDVKYETTSPGLGLPQWVYSVWLTVLSVLIVLRILGRLIRVGRAR